MFPSHDPGGYKDFGGKNNYGHAETVIGVNGDTIYTVSWNRKGDGAQSFETYSVKDLQNKYGDKWGFTDSTLKAEYAAALGGMLGTPEERIAETNYDATPDWFQKLMKEYVKGNYTEENIRGKIGRISGLSDEEIEAYKSLFDDVVDQPAPKEGSFAKDLWKTFATIIPGGEYKEGRS